MDRQQITERMDALVASGAARMAMVAHSPNIQYAAILFMNPAEAREFLQLRLALPSAGQERAEARARLANKIRSRK